MYDIAPWNFFLKRRNNAKTTDIWAALAMTAKMPPPIVALQTQKVVMAFQSTNVR